VEKASCIRPYASLRSKPKTTAEQQTQALFADPIDVFERGNGWAKVVLADGSQGYLEVEALGEPLPKDRAHVVVVPQAAGRCMGTWLPATGLRPEPRPAAVSLDTGRLASLFPDLHRPDIEEAVVALWKE